MSIESVFALPCKYCLFACRELNLDFSSTSLLFRSSRFCFNLRLSYANYWYFSLSNVCSEFSISAFITYFLLSSFLRLEFSYFNLDRVSFIYFKLASS
mmetsp:Transcript_45993/g.33754  ORF Transcript_45993/g.33754 Transcript_45993/m.33754 type:complete len:98 (-) Transcript_45993:854-1147(-)